MSWFFSVILAAVVCGGIFLLGRQLRREARPDTPEADRGLLVQIVAVGDGPLSGNVCIGEVLCFHVAGALLLPDETVDLEKLDLIGRLGGDGYSTVRDRFDLPKPTGPAALKR